MMKLVVFSLILIAPLLVNGFSHSRTPGVPGALNSSYFDCDPSGLLLPCLCKHLSSPVLECNGLVNNLQFLSPLAAMRSSPSLMSIQKLILRNSTMRFLLSDIFKGVQFRKIEVHSSTLSALTDSERAFVGLEKHLLALNIRDTVIHSEWDWSIIKHLSSMTEVIVHNGNVPYLDKPPEDSQMPLESVMIYDSGLTYLHPEVLRNFPKLSRISLIKNRIKDVKRTMFPTPALKLHQLFLYNNEIESLPEDMFTGMPAISYINLDGNKLLTLNDKTFSPLKKSKLLVSVRINPLQCDNRLLWTKKKSFELWAYCQNPLELRHKKVEDLTSEEMTSAS